MGAQILKGVLMENWVVLGGRSMPYIEKFHLHPLLARILAARVSLEDTPEFLNPNAPLASPWLMMDMERAVDTIMHHLETLSTIRIVGDYDVDGLTSTAILYLGLKNIKPDGAVTCRIPERIGEGYGFNRSIAEEAVRDGVKLVLTCDNGIREIASAAYLAEQQVDLVITDHHEIEKDENGIDVLPKAAAVINPHREEDKSPQRTICGAMVAYQLIRALHDRYKKEVPPVLLGYAALGTVCDVMPLVKENRKVVYQGFKALNAAPTVGIKALLEAGGVDTLTPYTAGFVVGPMINAGGRLGSQNRYLPILFSEDIAICRELATELAKLNRERQELTEAGIEAGLRQLDKNPADMVKVIFLPELHESIAGLVAGKIKEKCNRPVFVITKGEEGLKGSGRSIRAYSMFEEMNKAADCFSRFGGHPMAAGLSMAAEKGKEEDVVERLRRTLNENTNLTEADCEVLVQIDSTMPMQQLTTDVVQLLEQLAPYGTGNPRPLLAQKGLILKRCQFVGKSRRAVRLTLAAEGIAVQAMCFNVDLVREIIGAGLGEQGEAALEEGAYFGTPFAVDVAYQAEVDWYTGYPKVKITIQHMRISK